MNILYDKKLYDKNVNYVKEASEHDVANSSQINHNEYEELEQLKKEVAKLKLENQMLKQAAMFFAALA